METGRTRRRLPLAYLGVLPFFLYATAFLFWPAAKVMFGAFQDDAGGLTLDHVQKLFDEPYRTAFKNSIEVSLVTAGLGAVFGLLLAYAAIREGTPRFVRAGLTTFSGVAANFAGIPLAAAFIATLGTIGVVTQFMTEQLGFNPYDHGFSVFSKTGIEIVYLYFQIPLMILVIAPAIDGLRREWREAALNLGASNLQFWRYVGIPVLMPSLLGAMILLFGNAFAAYATALALTSGSIPLVPTAIASALSGNVLAGRQNVGLALGLTMVVVIAVVMVAYLLLQRRAAPWALR